jgi:hypothetical protein
LNKRKFSRLKRKGKLSRAELVYLALMNGRCVECFENIEQVSEKDPEYIGKNHVRCPKCGWQAQTSSILEE